MVRDLSPTGGPCRHGLETVRTLLGMDVHPMPMSHPDRPHPAARRLSKRLMDHRAPSDLGIHGLNELSGHTGDAR
jgi:hypothetical protein